MTSIIIRLKFKVEYKVFHSLKQNSGFGWNEESKIPTAPDEVWESYLEVCYSQLYSVPLTMVVQSHPKAAKYRRKTLPLYEKLFELFEGTIATGEYAFGPDGFPASNAEYDSDSVNMQSSITASEPLVEDELGSGELDEDQQAESSPEGSPPSSKRRRVRSSRGKSPGIVLAESIDRLTDSREASTFTPETWSNRATEEFFKSIADDMSEDKVCFALEVLEDSKKAAIFLKIPSIPVRLLWMERQIEQVVARSSS